METPLVFFFEKIIVYMPGKSWHGQNLAICCQSFWPKLTIWEFMTYYSQRLLWIIFIFGMEYFLMVSCEKIIVYMPGKFWYGETFTIYAIFGQNWQFWEFWPITSKRLYESSYLLAWKLFFWSSLRKSYCIYQENSDMAKLWAFNKAKIWPFLSEIDRFESFWSITSKRRYESS